MALEAMEMIIKAEEAARAAKQQAQAEIRQALMDAEKAGAEEIEKAKQRAAEESAGLISATEKTAEEKAAELFGNTENKKAAIRAKAEARMGDAVELILGRIVNS